MWCLDCIVCNTVFYGWHFSPYTGRDSPCVLLNVPDGHQKDMPTAGSKHKQEASEKEVD